MTAEIVKIDQTMSQNTCRFGRNWTQLADSFDHFTHLVHDEQWHPHLPNLVLPRPYRVDLAHVGQDPVCRLRMILDHNRTFQNDSVSSADSTDR
jgi:hypothetical protein